MPFQFSTMTFDDVPMPRANRPGAAEHIAATDWASVVRRGYAGTIVVPSRSVGVHAAARTSGVNVSKLPDSADQRSV